MCFSEKRKKPRNKKACSRQRLRTCASRFLRKPAIHLWVLPLISPRYKTTADWVGRERTHFPSSFSNTKGETGPKRNSPRGWLIAAMRDMQIIARIRHHLNFQALLPATVAHSTALSKCAEQLSLERRGQRECTVRDSHSNVFTGSVKQYLPHAAVQILIAFAQHSTFGSTSACDVYPLPAYFVLLNPS